ncbi:MAG: cytochrome c peroxidase [Sulfitobacter sp.]
MKRFIPLVAFTFGAVPLFAQQLPLPVDDAAFGVTDLSEAKLGQLLFYDPILSGNKQTACATCHHPALGTSDGVSLSFGDGGIGMGPTRTADPENMPEERIPRNSPVLFNLGAQEFSVLFHDGRLEADPSQPAGIRTPMGGDMLAGFTSILSAQTMFPVLSRDEMAGSFDENDVGRLVRQGIITGEGGAWDVLSRRVAQIPEYAVQFQAVYPAIDGPDDIAFTDISNAIAAFVAYEWRSDTAPFDAVLQGVLTLSGAARAGQELFYGTAKCSTCHAGPFLTDHAFHAMAAPQLGPGKSATFQDHHRDDGRFRVTGREEDRYAFRTPSLRNIALSAPYGHAGGHADLAAFVAAHTDPARSLADWDRSQAILPAFPVDDFAVMDDAVQVQHIAAAAVAQPVTLNEAEIADIVAFLDTLTDPVSISGRLGVPDVVPSGLPVPKVD